MAIIATSGQWNDALLEPMRRIGDEPADGAIAALYATRDTPMWGEIHRELNAYVNNASSLPPQLPPELRAYLESTPRLTPEELATAMVAEEFFMLYGPEILMLLGCFSLPAAFAAAKGVQVLGRTEFIQDQTRIRLFQTAQMLVDVMSPGGLGPGGKGLCTIQKVRLLHGAIRHLIRKSDPPWDEAQLGVPINQEDLAGTMLTFSSVILEGLRKLDIEVSPRHQEAYFSTWCTIGRMMGVQEALIPRDLASGVALMKAIQYRQIGESPQGIRMTEALLKSMSEGPFSGEALDRRSSSMGGRLLDGVARFIHDRAQAFLAPVFRKMFALLMRRCLGDEYDAQGRSAADLLRVPTSGPIARILMPVGLRIAGLVVADITNAGRRRAALRWFNLFLIEWMVAKQVGDRRSLFSVPDTLHGQWTTAPTS
jgi:hypothetical protein